jgi:hypothetical protein
MEFCPVTEGLGHYSQHLDPLLVDPSKWFWGCRTVRPLLRRAQCHKICAFLGRIVTVYERAGRTDKVSKYVGGGLMITAPKSHQESTVPTLKYGNVSFISIYIIYIYGSLYYFTCDKVDTCTEHG